MEMASGLGPLPALPGAGWPSTTGLVQAVDGGHPSSSLSLSLPLFFLSPVSSSSRFIFTAVVARSAGEGRSNPIGCRPGADGGHYPGLRPGVPIGTPPCLNPAKEDCLTALTPIFQPLPPPEWSSGEVRKAVRPRHGHSTTRPWLG